MSAVVLLWVYIQIGQAKNIPDHGGNRTYDIWTMITFKLRDVPDPDSTIRYPVKYRHPALSGIRVKFAGYCPG